MKVRHFLKDFLSYGLLSFASKSVSFITLPLLTRLFTQDEYAVLDLIVTFSSFLGVFITLSFDSAIARFWNDYSESVYQKYLISDILIIIILNISILLIIVLGFKNEISLLIFGTEKFAYLIVVSLISIIISSVVSIPMMVLRMQRRLSIYSLFSILYTICHFIVLFLLLYTFKLGLYSIFLSPIIVYSILLPFILYLVKDFFAFNLKLPTIKLSFFYSLPLIPSFFVTWFNGQFDKILLFNYKTLADVAIFGASARLSIFILLLISIFRQSWLPFSMELISKDFEFAKKRYLYFYKLYITTFIVLALFFVTFSSEFYSIILPVGYRSGVSIFPLLILSHILHGLASIVNIGIVITKKSYHNFYASFLGTFINVFCSFLLIPVYGIFGASIGTFFSELIFVIYFIYYSNKLCAIRFSYSFLILTIISFLVISFIIYQSSFFIENFIFVFLFKFLFFSIVSYLYIKVTIIQDIYNFKNIIVQKYFT